MIKTYGMIMNDLSTYKNPKSKLGRLVSEGIYTQIIRGLYETNPNTPGHLLAGSIYGPSYLSFDFALAYHGMIPERVMTYTSATFGKKRTKKYETPLGNFNYRDVPKLVYPLGILLITEGEYTFQIATAEKALCDKLYTMHPIKNQSEMLSLLEDDLRIDMGILDSLELEDIDIIAANYHSSNVELLNRLMRRLRK